SSRRSCGSRAARPRARACPITMSTPAGSDPIWNRRNPRRACASTWSASIHEGGTGGARGARGVSPDIPVSDLMAVALARTIRDGEVVAQGVNSLLASQIDQHLRLNLTVIGDRDRPRVRLPGGGGAAVLAQVIPHVVVWRTRHTPEIFVPKVDFVTAQGNVEAVVTPLGVLRALDGRLVLDARFPGVSRSEERRVGKECRCGLGRDYYTRKRG